MSNIGDNSSRSERHSGQAPIAPEPRPVVLRPHETVINPEQRAAAQLGMAPGSENSGNPTSSISSPPPNSTLVHTLFPSVETMGDAATARVDGVTLGDYRVLQRIRAGGMGSVFRAQDERLNRVVALKVLPPGPARDPGTVLRFQHEAQSAAQLDHDNVARVYASGQHHGLHYIAFEFIPGSNLRDQIVQFGRVPVLNAVSYTLQIATALLHTSAHAIVHRDIKPSNIIITPEGRAKLVDLGLAKKLTRDDGDVELTSAGTTLGTFDYISPEQARDPRQADIRSDIYSLGCTLYHMLTGAPPFPDGTMLQKLLQHQGDEAPDPRSVNRNVPEQLALIVRRMMAKDPRKRYQTPEQLVRELLTVARQIGLHSATPEGVVWVAEQGRLSRLWEQHAAWVVTSAVLLAIVAGIEFRGSFWPAVAKINNRETDESANSAGLKNPTNGLAVSNGPLGNNGLANNTRPSDRPPVRPDGLPPGQGRPSSDRGSADNSVAQNVPPKTDGAAPGPARNATNRETLPEMNGEKSPGKSLAKTNQESTTGPTDGKIGRDLASNPSPEMPDGSSGKNSTAADRATDNKSLAERERTSGSNLVSPAETADNLTKGKDVGPSVAGSKGGATTKSPFADAIRQGIEIAANVARVSPRDERPLSPDGTESQLVPAQIGDESQGKSSTTATSTSPSSGNTQSNGTTEANGTTGSTGSKSIGSNGSAGTESRPVSGDGSEKPTPVGLAPRGNELKNSGTTGAKPGDALTGDQTRVSNPVNGASSNRTNGNDSKSAIEADGVPELIGISPMPQLPNGTDLVTPGNTGISTPSETGTESSSVGGSDRSAVALAAAEFLILNADGKPREGFQSLAAACSRATDGSVIELRFNGRRSERPIRIANTRLTLRAAAGYRPEIDFEPDRAVGDDLLRGMLTIAGGNVSITGINLRASITGAALTEGWSLLLLRQPELVQLRDLVLTVKSPTGAAVSAIAIRPSVGGMTTDMEITTGLARAPGQLEAAGVMVRSDGGVINLRDIDSFRMSFNQSLLLANSTAILCSGLTQSSGIGNRVELRMDRVTAVSQRAFLSTEVSEANRSLPKMQVSASDCLFVTAGSSKETFVSLASAAAASEIRESLTWAGQRNLYEGTRLFRTLLSRSGAFAQESLDFAGWKRANPSDAEPRNGILNWPLRPRWSELPMSEWTPDLMQYRSGGEPPVGADSSALRALFSVPEKSAN